MIDPHEIIETLEYAKRVIGDENEVLMKPIDKSIKELRQALAQPEQRGHCTCGDPEALGVVHFRTRPCFHYIHQPKREWVGLTDEEIDLYALDIGVTANKAPAWLVVYAKDIEAKLKEKNT